MRISDWSSDVCSSDLAARCRRALSGRSEIAEWRHQGRAARHTEESRRVFRCQAQARFSWQQHCRSVSADRRAAAAISAVPDRSEEHTSELQSLMRISYAVFCLKKKKSIQYQHSLHTNIH